MLRMYDEVVLKIQQRKRALHMKKVFVAAATVTALTGSLLFGQADVAEASKAKYITAAQAKSIAVKAVGGKVVDIEFEGGKGAHYEVEVRNAKEEVELEVNAVSGKVKVAEREALKQKQQAKLITKDKAVQIAKNKLGGKGTVKKAKLDEDDGVRYYDIELKVGKAEYEFEIHATTGKILSYERD